MRSKVFVEVTVQFSADGRMLPLAIKWEDGRTFVIDRVLEVRHTASLKAGGQGVRYTCRIGRAQTFLFFDHPSWFVEGKR